MKKLYTAAKKALHEYIEWLCFEQIMFLDRLGIKGPMPQVGDIVEYNWKAKICIASAIEEKKGFLKVTNVTEYATSINIDYIILNTGESSSCDAYWTSPVEGWRIAT